MDFYKPFDSVNHNALLQFLNAIGIGEPIFVVVLVLPLLPLSMGQIVWSEIECLSFNV